MFDIGWSELLVIGVVALIVIGPKDLPHLFHSLGRFTAKVRSMAREFTTAMEDAAKGSGLDEAAGSLKEMKSLTSKKALGLDALDRAAERFEKWDPKAADSRTRAAPDPAPPPTPIPARDGATAASAAPVGADHDNRPAQPAAADTTPAAEPGKRRLHAVRRADMKDD